MSRRLYVNPDQFDAIRKLELDCIIFNDSWNDGKWISGLKRICGSTLIESLMYKGPIDIIVNWD